MGNLRERAERDLAVTLEGDWSFPVELTDPDGIKYTETNNQKPLVGQVIFERIGIDPDTGEDMVVLEASVTLRLSSLTRVPEDGETWFVRMPSKPSPTAPLANYIFSKDRPASGSQSLGIITLFVQKAKQS